LHLIESFDATPTDVAKWNEYVSLSRKESYTWAQSILHNLCTKLDQVTITPKLACLLRQEFNGLQSHFCTERIGNLEPFFPSIASLGLVIHDFLHKENARLKTISKSAKSKTSDITLSSAYGQQPAAQKSNEKHISSPATAGMLNMGFSGGLAPGGGIAHTTWANAMDIMDSYECDFFFAIGARCPENTPWALQFPHSKFTLLGDRSMQFNAVLALVRPNLVGRIMWETAWSKVRNIMWLRIGTSTISGGFVIPPRRAGKNEKERIALVKTLFCQFDAVLKIANKEKILDVSITGDLNPSSDIVPVFEDACRHRGLNDVLPQCATHERGRHLDVHLRRPSAGQQSTSILHDGRACRPGGCNIHHCGALAKWYHTNNFDHYPSTWTTWLEKHRPRGCLRLEYSKSPGKWEAAIATKALHACKVFASEARSKFGQDIWHLMDTTKSRKILETIAWIWRSVLCLAAIQQGDTTCRHSKNTGLRNMGNKGQIRDALSRALSVGAQTALSTLKKLQAPRKQGLSFHMIREENDDDGTSYPRHYIGPEEALQGAMEYSTSKASKPSTATWDEGHLAKQRRSWQNTRRSIKLEAAPTSDIRPFNNIEYASAKQKISPSTGCAGLPFALVSPKIRELDCAWSSLASLVLPAGVIPSCWFDGVVDHHGKPGKPHNRYEGFRELTRSFVEGRVLEELLGCRILEPLVEAAGIYQDGMGDATVANAASLDVHLCRKAQGLPSGDLCTDKLEAFDRKQMEPTMQDIATATSIHGIHLLLLAEAIQQGAMRICHEFLLSEPLKKQVGLIQGRILSPATYCASSASAATLVNSTRGVGVGLNPTQSAVEAFLASKTEMEAEAPDLAEVDQWMSLIDTGNLGWLPAMQAASSDSVRLAMVDRSASIIVGLRQYLDDQKCKVAGRAQTRLTFEAILQQSARQGECLRFGPGKTEIVARFSDCRPIGLCQFTTTHRSLGFTIDERHDGETHLRSMESSLVPTWLSHISTLRDLRAPLSLALLVHKQCTTPSTMHSAELLIFRRDFDKRANALQEKAGRLLLGFKVASPAFLSSTFLGGCALIPHFGKSEQPWSGFAHSQKRGTTKQLQYCHALPVTGGPGAKQSRNG